MMLWMRAAPLFVVVLGVLLQSVFLFTNEKKDEEMVVVVRATADEVGSAVGELVLDVSQKAIASHGRFTLALSGGSLPKVLLDLVTRIGHPGYLIVCMWHAMRVDFEQGVGGDQGRCGLLQVVRVFRR